MWDSRDFVDSRDKRDIQVASEKHRRLECTRSWENAGVTPLTTWTKLFAIVAVVLGVAVAAVVGVVAVVAIVGVVIQVARVN
jgi:hypothetical protein